MRCSTISWFPAGGKANAPWRLIAATTYQVKIATADADPQTMELEVSDYLLHLRVPAVTGASRHTCRFAHPIDSERVTASWREGILQIVLPEAASAPDRTSPSLFCVQTRGFPDGASDSA